AKAEEPKTDEAKAEEAKDEEAKAEEAKDEEAKADEPKAEEAESEEAESEESKDEESAELENVAERIQELRGQWNQAGEVPERHVAGLQKNYSQVTDRLVAAYGEQLQGTDLDPEVNHRKREQIIDELEQLVAKTKEELKDEPDEPSLEDLASQLKQALAANTIRGAGGGGADDAWKRREQKAQRLEDRFKKLPGKAHDELMVRLSNARLELASLKPKAS
ncbi:MAG: hypothetical protein SX243_24970, partial [Acidobacteriota bacterium]|nr:hypothetical protein [Acidobacteriota bacterium]